MSSAGIELLAKHQAQKSQATADLLTTVRFHGALPISAVMAATEPNWPTTVVDAALWATDAADGQFARSAQACYPELARTKASFRDPEADKRKFYGGLAGIAIRSFLNGDTETSVVVAANAGVSFIRDRAMAQNRKTAEKYGLSVDAIPINKKKTQLAAIASVALASPLSRNTGLRRTALAGLTAATVLGVIGEHSYRQTVAQQIKETSD